MTATYPVRTEARYRGVVYGIDVLDHSTGQVVRNDYVGQTRQRGRARENQHRDDQPWSDLIVGSPRVLWEGVCTAAELDERERRFIQDPPSGRRPRLNWQLNEDNPHQIPKWVLLEQRHARDDRAGVPRWQPLAGRSRDSLMEWDTPDRPSPERKASPRPRVKRKPWLQALVRGGQVTLVWLGMWAATTLTGWIFAMLKHWGGPAETFKGAAAVLPAVLIALLFLSAMMKERRGRKLRRVLAGRFR